MPSPLKPVVLNTDLRHVPVLAKLPEVKLQWIIDQGKEIKLQPGELLREPREILQLACFFVAGRLLDSRWQPRHSAETARYSHPIW